jgi:hypothetical protein
VGAAVLIGRRLARPIVVALALMGASILLGGLAPNALGAAAAFAVVGGVAVTVHAGTQTLLQRAVDDEVLSRVFGVLEGVWAGTLAIGAASAPFLVRAFGVRGAFVAAGAALVAVALAGSTRLRRIDDAVDVPAERIELLGSIPMFEPLPTQALERIARRLRPVAFEPGTTIIEQGEPGDVLYVVSSGEVDTLVDGGAKGYRGPREYFGEIALLHDVPRTATVRARTAVTAFTLDRAAFLAALTGEPAVRAMAESGAAVRLRR